uniref:Uncharacterized protein n=1 Tax=Trichogramma kaykai TaxID=54128 RepID=A0ABD2WGN7_9HYME
MEKIHAEQSNKTLINETPKKEQRISNEKKNVVSNTTVPLKSTISKSRKSETSAVNKSKVSDDRHENSPKQKETNSYQIDKQSSFRYEPPPSIDDDSFNAETGNFTSSSYAQSDEVDIEKLKKENSQLKESNDALIKENEKLLKMIENTKSLYEKSQAKVRSYAVLNEKMKSLVVEFQGDSPEDIGSSVDGVKEQQSIVVTPRMNVRKRHAVDPFNYDENSRDSGMASNSSERSNPTKKPKKALNKNIHYLPDVTTKRAFREKFEDPETREKMIYIRHGYSMTEEKWKEITNISDESKMCKRLFEHFYDKDYAMKRVCIKQIPNKPIMTPSGTTQKEELPKTFLDMIKKALEYKITLNLAHPLSLNELVKRLNNVGYYLTSALDDPTTSAIENDIQMETKDFLSDSESTRHNLECNLENLHEIHDKINLDHSKKDNLDDTTNDRTIFNSDDGFDISDDESSNDDDSNIIDDEFPNDNDFDRSNGPKDFVHDDRTMFPSSGCTVSQVIMMLSAIIIKFNPTKKFQESLIEFVKILAGKEFETWKCSPYTIKKQLQTSPEIIKKHFFCVKCYVILFTIEPSKRIDCSVQCTSCNDEVELSSLSKNFFITLDIKSQFETLLNRPDVQKQLENFKDHRKKAKGGIISDIQDSSKYKKLQTEHSEILTFNFNADGAQLFESSKKSLWPLQLYINELPAEIRFKHIVIAALMETESEPTADLINLYMRTMTEDIQDLYINGIAIKNCISNEIEYKKILPFTENVDTVARPKLQNRIQFNGFYGCSWCYHRGLYIDGSMRYTLLEDDPPLRSHHDHECDLKLVEETGKSVQGIKGKSILLSWANLGFDIVWDLPPDYMHRVLLGITKQLWNKWTSLFFNKFNLDKIKKRMQNMKLCRDIRRSIRPLEFSAKYKAMEWRTWLLFVSLPALNDILPDEEFLSYCHLVDGIYRLLENSISNEDLQRIEYNMLKFVGESQISYLPGFMTFNIHSVQHYRYSVEYCGPLWATSAFPFENGIYDFMKEINAPNGCLQQLAEKWIRKNEYQASLSHIEDNEDQTLQYCKSPFSSRLPLQNCTIVEDVLFTGKELDQDETVRNNEPDASEGKINSTDNISNQPIITNTIASLPSTSGVSSKEPKVTFNLIAQTDLNGNQFINTNLLNMISTDDLSNNSGLEEILINTENIPILNSEKEHFSFDKLIGNNSDNAIGENMTSAENVLRDLLNSTEIIPLENNVTTHRDANDSHQNDLKTVETKKKGTKRKNEQKHDEDVHKKLKNAQSEIEELQAINKEKDREIKS